MSSWWCMCRAAWIMHTGLHVHGLWFKFSLSCYTVVHKNLRTVPRNMPTMLMNDEYRKALIFRGTYISQSSRIHLHSRNLFSTKIVSTSRGPYTSVIHTSSTQIALCKYFESCPFWDCMLSEDFFSYL